MKRLFLSTLINMLLAVQLVSGQCRFTVSDLTPCAGEEVVFQVTDPDAAASYGWDIDRDGTADFTGESFTFDFRDQLQDTTLRIILYENGDSCGVEEVTVAGRPDPRIGVAPGLIVADGNEFRACNGSPTIDLVLFNASETFAANKSYTINWGDGSPSETFDNSTFSNTATIAHTYMRLGYFTIFVTAEHENGCVFTENYIFYNGGNPSVGLVNPGNTVGLCAPATLDFPITNTENNPPGTEYMIYVNGEVVDTFTQETVPDVFSYTFTENSCGATTTTGSYTNAFDLRIVASNPCNSSAATIEPIEVTTPPIPDFAVTSPVNLCAGEEYTFTDLSRDIIEVVSGNPTTCIDVLSPNWTISGNAGEDWTVSRGSLFGSEEIGVEFLNPGAYTIELTLISFSCGSLTVSREIVIFEPPQILPVDSVPLVRPDGGAPFCAPLEASMPEVATGDSLTYHWVITPATGWTFLDSTAAEDARPRIRFEEGGTYDITAEVSNPCATVLWQGRVEVPGPPAIALEPIPDFCQMATLDFDSTALSVRSNGSAISRVSWRFPGAETEADDRLYPQGIHYPVPGRYAVEVSLENACGIQTAVDTFQVQEPTNLLLPADTSLCVNAASFPLNAVPAGGTWSGPGVERRRFSPAAAGTGVHRLVYRFGVGACFMEADMRIEVLEAPLVDVGPDLSLCANDAAIDLVGSPAGGVWQTEDSWI